MDEYHYYISSLEQNDPQLFVDVVRSHWGVEKSLHWVLDVAFREDDSRIRSGNARENFALLRHGTLHSIFYTKKNPPKSALKINALLRDGMINIWLRSCRV